MSRIGFIGLGIMGSPMAANLVRAGHQVAGHDHKQSAMDRLAALLKVIEALSGPAGSGPDEV